jgi:thioredoxin reductase (NADPH)
MKSAPEPVAAVVGAGPAGMAAALQLKRMGIRALLFERDAPGGLLRNAALVENYLGFPRGVDGPALVRHFCDQLRAHRVPVRREEVLRAGFRNDRFHLETDRGAHAVPFLVVASGTRPLPFDGCAVPGAAQGRCHHEVWPLRRLRGRHIVIVGGGDAAFDHALALAPLNRVTLLMRGAGPRGLLLLWERAGNEEAITLSPRTRLTAVRARGRGLELTCAREGRSFGLKADRLLFAVGREPALDFLAASVARRLPELKAAGRLHLIGDAVNGRFRQTAIAVGDGLRAAMAVASAVEGRA